MASKKLLRDFLLSKQSLFLPRQGLSISRRLPPLVSVDRRRYSVFKEFSEKIKGEVKSNPEFEKSVKELKERTKQTTEQLYKQVDEVWTEAEATAKKVSHNVKEKLSAANEEVKETFWIGKQDSSGSTDYSKKQNADANQGSTTSSGEKQSQHSKSSNAEESLFGKFKSTISSSSSNVSAAFQKLKDTKVVNVTKKGYDIIKEELSSNPTKRQRAPVPSNDEISKRTEIVVVPIKQSWWSKKFDEIKDKGKSLPVFKRFIEHSDPVKRKGQEILEDIRERYETTDNPIIHKIQDINDSMFQETDAAISYKEIRQRDPCFSLPEFVGEVQEAIKPVLNAYIKGDVKTLKKYCSPELIERCKAEHNAYQSHGIFFDNKILHVSDVDVRETKMLESSPVIVVMFQTQQIHCVRDRHGEITEGGKDTIHNIFYLWALQQVNQEDNAEDGIYLMWKLREMHQQGIQALI
ncbi:mitochondrial import inner membrane translocase subunit TIM44-2-like [Lotus japonicus]|uniref:mitochondrial import inner membrane translocase subunit TIM44-2-like n=1 Tax=Lotus japonicus TaxID=34305 RepID=UPI00258395DE|nr:mitochondrial import inner membrane translocase subunit TIM44-2-like [Lotus japonicus]